LLVPPKLSNPPPQAWGDFIHSDNAHAYAPDDKGIAFAKVTQQEAYRSHREADFAREVGNRGQRFKEGEIVILTESRPEYRRNGDSPSAAGFINSTSPLPTNL
jgi:hypothetical protein